MQAGRAALTPNPSPALREALTPNPAPALRERGDLDRVAPAPLTSPFSPRMRAEGGRGVGAGATSLPSSPAAWARKGGWGEGEGFRIKK